MTTATTGQCRRIRAESTYDGKQGFTYFEGIARESTGAQAICMHLLRIPPGGRAKAHMHENHETAIYVIEGRTIMHWGPRLENLMEAVAGDMVYIPADVPHLPINDGDTEAVAVIARTDPHEQESVVLLPELEACVPS
ncbi:cupin domain-containing protein [Salipiger mucosus]|uniref:Erwinia chrysanthemi phospholipase C (PlcA) n=1 Tax=Salipiger mucosus DSM 16094 TaxID=1123237 RepID=S9QTM7_9RHOB|nr:cupin domain-containing protein [Salipiger mucosus]EPX82992.1 Erwinia chrysanthemi phospholipase C (plcA) [Salipiger mucosus DSM 16094]